MSKLCSCSFTTCSSIGIGIIRRFVSFAVFFFPARKSWRHKIRQSIALGATEFGMDESTVLRAAARTLEQQKCNDRETTKKCAALTNSKVALRQIDADRAKE
jgi:hypothetical protein